jgi:hypothetical protein
MVWPFTNKQERQAEAMSMILAENSYERKMERMAGWVRTIIAMIAGVGLTFALLFGLDVLGYTPSDVWDYIVNR